VSRLRCSSSIRTIKLKVQFLTVGPEARVRCENSGLAHAAADALPYMTDVRFLSSEREFVPLDEVLSLYSMIDETPRLILNISLFLDRAQKGLTWVGNMYIIDILMICFLEMAMRKTTVHIDESLLADAIKAIGAKTQREAIEAGLKCIVQRKNREALRHELGTFDIDLTLEELERLRNAE
jgi:Arc/MetJ family transcription regulator